jgi:hypothetical protein
MKPILIALGLTVMLGVAAEAQQASTPASRQSAAAPSDAQIVPGKWTVGRVRCSDLLAASDDDRASAAMFYYGYLVAKANIHVIDVTKISDNISKVLAQCSAKPSMTVPEAFRQALARGK